MAQLKDLIVNGPSRFIGDVYATTFTGDLNGNANTAISATTAGSAVNDGSGNSIVDTYLKKSGGAMDLNGYPALRLKTYQIQSFEISSQNNDPAVISFNRDGSLGYLGFYEANNPIYITNNGTRYSLIHAGNIDSQSVNYATTSGSCSGNAATATKATQDSGGNIIKDTYIKKDGSNGTAAGVSALINKLDAGSSTPTDADYYVCQYAGGGTATTTYYRRPMSSMWNWIKAKTDTLYPTKSGSGATGTWGINITGNAASATNAGNATNAVYATSAGDASALTAERFDSDDPTPSSKNGLTFQFSYNLGSGASGWWNVLNMRSYSDSNYTSSQIITPADNPGTDTGYSGDMKWRQGRNSTWLGWKTLLDSNNYTTYCTPTNIGAAPLSHTHTKSEITDFAHTHTKSQITDFAHTHTKSQITDFPTSLPASDVYSWAKQSTKPSYIGSEVKLTGYSKASSYSVIAASDTVNQAIGKLEGAISGLEELLASI